MSKLFDPLTLREVTLRNRIVVAPMWQYVGVDGFPTDWHLMHLGRFADGGAALVFQEATAVERRGCGTVGDLGIWDDKFIEPLSRVAAIIRNNGAVPGIQLGHAGRKARMKTPMQGRGPLERSSEVPDWDAWQPICPSAVALKEHIPAPRAMTKQDIAEVIAAFGAAAERAVRAGYEALEIHAGHGYLLHEFLSPLTNQRADEYGGSLTNRMRIVLEVTEVVRAAWPASRPLFIRLSCMDGGGWEVENTIDLVNELKPLGIDIVDCSTGGLVGGPLREGDTLSYGYQVQYSHAVREATGMPTMAVGLIVHAAHAEQIITAGDADLVAVAREVLQNPNWPLDAALKLGIENPYAYTAQTSGWWLSQRATSVPNFAPSTMADAVDFTS
jgi:2,4-dienoyl-CoA reductase-like NADH-dependent reductase (Old Yellow Enzyme family)